MCCIALTVIFWHEWCSGARSLGMKHHSNNNNNQHNNINNCKVPYKY